MYGNQVVKELERITSKKVWSRLKPEVAMPEYKAQAVRAIKMIRNSFQFYLGSFTEIGPLVDKFFYDETENVLNLFKGLKLNMPYKSFLLCWDHPYEEDKSMDQALKEMYGNKDLKSAALVNQETEDVISIQTFAFNIDPEARRWFMSPIITFYTFSDDITNTEFYNRYPPVEGSEYDRSRNSFIGSTVLNTVTDDMLADPSTLRVRQTDCAVVNMFLTLSNCPNVTTKVVHRHKPKNKKKASINKVRDYKVLGVSLPSRGVKHRYDKTDRKNRGIMPINWYKGHPKTYTEDAPLFGKHVGTWWWQPNIRGSKTAGFSDKDYCVKELG